MQLTWGWKSYFSNQKSKLHNFSQLKFSYFFCFFSECVAGGLLSRSWLGILLKRRILLLNYLLSLGIHWKKLCGWFTVRSDSFSKLYSRCTLRKKKKKENKRNFWVLQRFLKIIKEIAPWTGKESRFCKQRLGLERNNSFICLARSRRRGWGGGK